MFLGSRLSKYFFPYPGAFFRLVIFFFSSKIAKFLENLGPKSCGEGSKSCTKVVQSCVKLCKVVQSCVKLCKVVQTKNLVKIGQKKSSGAPKKAYRRREKKSHAFQKSPCVGAKKYRRKHMAVRTRMIGWSP